MRETKPVEPPWGRAVIFDIDGTLVDSVDLHAACWRAALAHFGIDVPLTRVRGQIGKGGDQLLPVFLPEDDLARRGEALERYRAESPSSVTISPGSAPSRRCGNCSSGFAVTERASPWPPRRRRHDGIAIYRDPADLLACTAVPFARAG